MSTFDEDPWATDAPAEDPWAAEVTYADPPRDEAQATIPPSNTTPSKESNTTVSNNAEAKIVTIIKYGSGFDAPWTTFHSASVEEAEATLNEAKGLLELTAKVAKYAKTLDSGASAAAPRGGNGGGQQRQSPPPGQQGKTCAHGEMKYVTGNGAKGPWKAYFCPLDRNDPDACKAVWVK
ncbi:hypothetical protein [Nonomuraea candida]|uniref:hypothetical protein n=1 Tax=Nonomuraea candida TaxID=359159 RepID=UPI0006947C25|nr:hypothetical protein [Nonomuraea candida]